MIIKAMNTMKKKQEEAPAGPSSTDALLMEIRDALKK
jgi:large conductance mechanosensitive channel